MDCDSFVILNTVYLIGQGVDYDNRRLRSNITFLSGVICASFDVPIINDELSEIDETFDIKITRDSLPFGVILGDHDRTTVTIDDNDGKGIAKTHYLPCKYIRMSCEYYFLLNLKQ